MSDRNDIKLALTEESMEHIRSCFGAAVPFEHNKKMEDDDEFKSIRNEYADFPPYLDCPKPDSDEGRYSKMSDTRLCSELDKIWKKQKELKEKEKIIQHIRSMRYQQNNWFNEEINSTELHF